MYKITDDKLIKCTCRFSLLFSFVLHNLCAALIKQNCQMRIYIITVNTLICNTHMTTGNMNTFSKQRKAGNYKLSLLPLKYDNNNYFITSQLSLNPLAPQVAALIKAAQDNQ